MGTSVLKFFLISSIVVGQYLSKSACSLSARACFTSSDMLAGSLRWCASIHDVTKFFHWPRSEMKSTPARVTVAGDAYARSRISKIIRW
eukprot:3427266-Prymnesium_polylepis.1